MIQILLEESVADALCCYLDEEDVFSEVVDALLRAIPAPQGTRQVFASTLYMTSEEVLDLPYRWSNKPGYTLRDFVKDHRSTADLNSVVWLINIRSKEAVPAVEGYMPYNSQEDREWFTHNLPQQEIVGFFHYPTGAFFQNNQDMIKYLIHKGYIKDIPC